MAALGKGLSMFANFICRNKNAVSHGVQQTRNVHLPARMFRDMNRRKLIAEYAPIRLRYVALKRNDILPPSIAADASTYFDEHIPRKSSLRHSNARCVVTNRGRGVVVKWRLSRFIFRDLADNNKLSGVIRALW